jgi:hypothetical protein
MSNQGLSVFNKIKSMNYLLKGLIVMMVGLSYSFTNVFSIFLFEALGGKVNPSLQYSLGIAELSVFIFFEILFFIFIFYSLRFIRKASSYKYYYYFTFVSFLLVIISIILLYINFYNLTNSVLFSFSSIYLLPIFVANSIYFYLIYKILKENYTNNIIFSALLVTVFNILLNLIGYVLSASSLFYFVSVLIMSVFLAFLVLTYFALRKALRKVEEIVVNLLITI